MKTILTALRDEEKTTVETARTIARALGGATISSAISPVEESEEKEPDTELDGKPTE